MCRTAPVGSHAITCRFGYPLGRTAGCARDVGPNRYHVETFGRGPGGPRFQAWDGLTCICI
jgi:hypothetical protein